VIFQYSANDIYSTYQSELMTLFCHDRLSQSYDRYFSNRHCSSLHPVVCSLKDVSIKLHIYDGEVSLSRVTEDDKSPYYVIVSKAVLHSYSLEGICNIYKAFQTEELGM
jgi:hypothetical protein